MKVKHVIELSILDKIFNCREEITKFFIIAVLPPDENAILKYNVVDDIEIPEEEQKVVTSFEKNIENIVTFEGKEYNMENDDELVCFIRNIKTKLNSK